MKTALLILSLGWFGLSATALAQEPPKEDPAVVVQRLVDSLQWKDGTIPIETGLANLKLEAGYRYLDPKDTEKILSGLWGNPPGGKTLGMFFPRDTDLRSDSAWGVILEGFEDEGYVKDDDAERLDAPKLLKEMQEAQEAANEERVKAGYRALELVGWALPPHYDKESKKLYWATDIKAKGGSGHSVNYYVRILGRKGYLVLNAIGGLEQLPEMQSATPQILSMVEFTEGNRYADFDPKTDKVAAYGILGLIAGAAGLKMAAKLGFLALFAKKFGVILLVLKKFWFLGAAALMSLWKRFTGQKNTPEK
jgi:uncharacterized membrane-anchored protein